ncbi:hypothetical protein AB4144_22930 [Rhizobiaceae sp. 2RAB30]
MSALFFSPMQQEFRTAQAGTPLPVLCGEARGEMGADYSSDKSLHSDWDDVAAQNPFNSCWYSIEAFRSLYPEYEDLKEDDLVYKLYERVGEKMPIPPRPWSALTRTASLALIPPIALFVVGGMIVWALLGFATTKAKPSK